MTVQRTGQVACHVRVREVARAAAAELYESMMSDNSFYNMWKGRYPGLDDKKLRLAFINANWPQCIQFARATLTLMLRRPELSDKMKEDIMEILEKDQSLRGLGSSNAIH